MKILNKLIIILLVMSIIPLGILGYTSLNTVKFYGGETNTIIGTSLETQAKDNMQNQAGIIASHMKSKIQSYLNDIKMIKKHPDISALMLDAKQTGKIEDDNTYKRFYPQNLAGPWTNVQDYFLSIANERKDDIDLIRIFYNNGYVVDGVATGKEDVKDYKGDKSWFKDTMNTELVKADDYYVSSISIARRTNSTAIRYTSPIDVNGERLGMININFKPTAVTSEIQNYKYGDSGYAMLIDTDYEDAEGKRYAWPVVISQPTDNGKPYLINEAEAGKAYIGKEQLVGDSGTFEFTKDGKIWVSAYQKVDWPGKSWYVVINLQKDEMDALATKSKDNVNEILSKTTSSLIMVLLLTIIITTIVAVLFAKSLTRPINELVACGNKIADGDLSAELPVIKTNDEIQDLSGTMSMLVGALKFLKQEKSKPAAKAAPKKK